MRHQIGIRGSWRPSQHLGPFIVFLELFLSCLCGPLSFGSVVVMRGCTWPTTEFGWVVRVNWHFHKCQHPGFPSIILYCDEMINAHVSVVLMLWLISVNLKEDLIRATFYITKISIMYIWASSVSQIFFFFFSFFFLKKNKKLLQLITLFWLYFFNK